MDGHYMFYIYGTLIIVIIVLNAYHLIYEKSTWYQRRTGLDSLTGGPMKMERKWDL